MNLTHLDGVNWVLRKQAADRLGVAPATLRQWCSRKQVRSVTDRAGVVWIDFDQAADMERRARLARNARTQKENVSH